LQAASDGVSKAAMGLTATFLQTNDEDGTPTSLQQTHAVIFGDKANWEFR
jgi:hypothetical protein